jgi:hypothetical protein
VGAARPASLRSCSRTARHSKRGREASGKRRVYPVSQCERVISGGVGENKLTLKWHTLTLRVHERSLTDEGIQADSLGVSDNSPRLI